MLCSWCFSIVVFSISTKTVQPANILAIVPIPLKSHFRIYQTLLEKLAEKGHQVDVISQFPRKTPLPGYTDFDVNCTASLYENIDFSLARSATTLQHLQYAQFAHGRYLCEAVAKTPVGKRIIGRKKEYDAIIIEVYVMDCILGYIYKHKAPTIGITTSINLPWASDLIGLPDNPSYIPTCYSPYTPHMSFLERLKNAVMLYITKLWYNYFSLEESNSYIETTFGKSNFHVRDVLKNISLLMVNSHFTTQQSRPIPANFIEIGGIHIKPNQVLPKDKEEYVKTDLRGVIIVSFGSYLKSEKLPKKQIVPFFEALAEIPYKILWKGDKANVAKELTIPKNIHFVPWLPQLEILCHPNLKLFITHSGAASLQESIYCGKPILSIPLWLDQFSNAKTAISKGIGVSIPILEVTKQKLSKALKELLENAKYTENAEKLSKLFRDRPMSALDTALYWTEYVIRHKGAPHLRSKGADLPWYQYYCIDILIIPSIIILLLLILSYRLFVVLLNITYSFAKSKLVRNKKKLA